MSRRITRSVAFLAAVTLVCLGSPVRADLILGLDSHDINQADGTPVSAWTSGYGSAAQTVPIRQPAYVASSAALGGHPAVALDNAPVGTDGSGMSTSVTGLSNTYTIMTLYAFHGNDTSSARVVQGGNGVFNAGGGAAANNWLLGPYGGTHRMYDGNWIFTNDIQRSL